MFSGCITESSGGREFKQSPTDAAAYNYQLGVEYLKNGNLQLARERLESSVEQDPTEAVAYSTLAIVYQRINEPKLADKAYRDAIRVAPNDGAVQNSYAVYLCGRKEFRDAEKMFLKAARNPLYSTPALAMTNAGVCMLERPDEAEAERYFRGALEVSKDYPNALFELARLKLSQDNALSSRAFLQRLMAGRTAPANVLLLAWQVEKALGDNQAADDFASELKRRFPESRQALAVSRGG